VLGYDRGPEAYLHHCIPGQTLASL